MQANWFIIYKVVILLTFVYDLEKLITAAVAVPGSK